MGLTGPPPTPHLELAQKGDFGGDLGAAIPHFSLCWPHFGPFLGRFWPILEASASKPLVLAGSWTSFRLVSFKPREFALFRGGGRQLLHFGSLGGLETAPICISGTHDRPRDDIWDRSIDFGPVASSDLPFWQRPAFFQQHSRDLAA